MYRRFFLKELRMASETYVQYGCGWSAPLGWRNFDASPTLRFERIPVMGSIYTKNKKRFPKNVEYGDIVKGLPIPDDSVDLIYCSHVLEHLALNDFREAIRNTHSLLRRGGVFRLVVPDIEILARRYLQSQDDQAAIEFIRKTGMGKMKKDRGVVSFLKSWLGNSQHLWMWDYKSLRGELAAAGFCEMRPAKFGDSSYIKFREVEDHIRWVDAVGVECKK